MRLVMLGGTGSGKGTQTSALCAHYQIPSISTGSILRDGITSGTELGKKAQPYLEKGELVPDELMIEFIKRRLQESDASQGWILEGYPRTAFQAEELDFLLHKLHQKLDWAIYLKVSESLMKERALNRGLVDDQPEVIQRRIQSFQDFTIPILEYYQYCDRLLTINGELSTEEVTNQIISQL
ncbi:MAG: adenylate kinase [Xenococcaceae cyanobacterium MO_207.B15]|nr:adenylate kinase [Xenococcaceae cyanobacterium MO_207.B15]